MSDLVIIQFVQNLHILPKMACRKFRHTTQHGAIEKYRVIQDRLFESDFDKFTLPTLPFEDKED